MRNLTAVSLFSCGGIGDLAIRSAGFDVLVSNEISRERHDVFSFNFPKTESITGDIWEKTQEIVDKTNNALNGRVLDLLYATPPCQGMSKNGRGKLLNAIRAGQKPAMDIRNRLVIPTMSVINALKPQIIIFENVPEMMDTLISDENGHLIKIVDYIGRSLGTDYLGRAEMVEFADYGVPQCRQRLITVFSRHHTIRKWFATYGTLMPPRTHSSRGLGGKLPWVTVRDAIAGFPALDAKNKPSASSAELPFHSVPLLDEMKYWWVANTPVDRGAFDNQCVACGYMDNPIHTARRDENGINRTVRETPVYCQRCGELLPRPSVGEGASRRLMKGFTSAYKRMSYDRPASALTRNLSYACSDNKLHPEQNRVLSLAEAMRLHTIDQFNYEWKSIPNGKRCSDKLIRELIGESIPPAGLQIIVHHLRAVYEQIISTKLFNSDAPLFAMAAT